MGFGRELQQQREARGVALEAIANNTKVSMLHLRALEAERRADLPGGVFNKGIVRSYCRFVGLEESEWLQRFATSELGAAVEPDLAAFAESVRRNRVTRPASSGKKWWGIVGMLFCLAALAWVTWRYAVRPRIVVQPAVQGVLTHQSVR